MKLRPLFIVTICSMLLVKVQSIEPASTVGAVAAAALGAGYVLYDHVKKIDKKSSDARGGPRKALVLSFHGWTGGGKNYVAQSIAETLFKLGLKSSYVHLFISTLHFPDEGKTDIYKLELQDWIRGNVTKCPQSLFIFDEIDKMGEGLIDAIKPFIDFHESIHGVDFRQSVFIFLSNTGGQQLTRKLLEAWKEGRKRNDVTYEELEELIQAGAFNEVGGLHQSSVIERSLIDHYVPFLPLELEHVKACAMVEAKRRGEYLSPAEIDRVADDIAYWPAQEQLFSTTGCKRVGQKVDMLLEEGQDDL